MNPRLTFLVYACAFLNQRCHPQKTALVSLQLGIIVYRFNSVHGFVEMHILKQALLVGLSGLHGWF